MPSKTFSLQSPLFLIVSPRFSSNFSQYGAKFSMPSSTDTYGDDANHFYSFNVGSAHIIAFSTEFYYYTEYGYDQIANQYQWLENDLRVQENRGGTLR